MGLTLSRRDATIGELPCGGEKEGDVSSIDLRIRNALVTIDPSSRRPAWHGAPTAIGLLRGVKEETALWRPHSGAANVREIALHIAFWENSVANRLTDGAVRLGFKQRKTSWAVQDDTVSEAQWREEIRLIKDAHAYLVKAVEAFNPRALDKPLGTKSTRPAIEFIHGAGEHSLYHAAQIKMLKTLCKRSDSGHV